MGDTFQDYYQSFGPSKITVTAFSYCNLINDVLGSHSTAVVAAVKEGHKLFFKNFLKFYLFLYVCECTFCMQVCSPMSCNATEVRSGCWIPLELELSWNWSLRWFSATMCVLGIEPQSSGRAVGALNH